MNSPLPLLQEYLEKARGEGADVELNQTFVEWIINYILDLEQKAKGE